MVTPPLLFFSRYKDFSELIGNILKWICGLPMQNKAADYIYLLSAPPSVHTYLSFATPLLILVAESNERMACIRCGLEQV